MSSRKKNLKPMIESMIKPIIVERHLQVCKRSEVTFSFNPKVGTIPQSLPIQEGNSFLETLGILFPTDLTYQQVSYHGKVKSESVVHK